MVDLITVASAKEHLGITATTWDAVLQTLVTRVSGMVERYCDRTFASTAYTEDYDGDGSEVLLTRQSPIVSVTSVHDDQNREFTSATLIQTTDYYVDTAKAAIKLIGGRFSRGVGNVRVAYTAGYASTPDAVAISVADIVGLYFNRRRSGGIASQSLGGQSTSWLGDWPADIVAALEVYKMRVYTR